MALVFGEERESTFIRTTVHDTTRTPTTTSAQGVVASSPTKSKHSTFNMDPVRSIDCLSKLTVEAIERIREKCEGNTVLPNLHVTLKQFRLWEAENDLLVEYNSASQEIVVLGPPNPIHQALEFTMNSWLGMVARSLTTVTEAYTNISQYSVKLDDGRKVPDTVLLSDNHRRKHPVMAVEIGWSETLEKLFVDAERLINGTRKGIDVVILLKIYEKNPHTENEFPWGINPHDLHTLRRMNNKNQLAPMITKWFRDNDLALLGHIDVDLYWYPCTRKTRPSRPLYRFECPDITQSPPAQRTGNFSTTLKTGKGTFLNRDMTANIEGQSFELPAKELEESIWKGARQEEKKRVFGLIEKAGI